MAPAAPLAYADLERFADDGIRRETIDGDLFVTPPPYTSHQDAVGALFVAFKAHAARTGGWAFAAPTGVYLGEYDVVQPDVIYVAADRLNRIEERYVRGAPTIVVEVLSPSTRQADRERKRKLYAVHAVPEYWIVDTAARTVEVLAKPHDADYVSLDTFADALVRSNALPGLAIRLTDIFARPPSE